MPNYDYDFRVLIDTTNGDKKSYGTSSFVSADGVQPILSSSQVLDRINSLKEIEYYNSKTYTTSSLDALFASKSLFTFSNTDTGTDYQFLSASIKGNPISGSILFTGNNIPTGSTGPESEDFIKRYKFFGNKVCNVLGIPENYWIYVDKFRFTNTGSEQNYLSGDVLGQSLHLTSNFAISNAGSIESDLPFQHARDTDRWLKWRNVSGSIPHNELQIGYSNKGNRYEIRTSDGENDLTGGGLYGTLPLIISASTLTLTAGLGGDSHISASGGIRVDKNSHFNQNLTIAGQNTTFTSNTVHNLNLDHSTHPMGISFNGFSEKMQFKVPVDGSSTTLMELSGSDEGTATLTLEGDISASGDLYLHNNKKIYFGDLNTFIYESNDNQLDFHVNDDRKLIVYNSGVLVDTDVKLAVGRSSIGSEALTVEGNISASGDLFIGDEVDVRNHLVVGDGVAYTTQKSKGAVMIATSSNALAATSNPENYHLHLRDFANSSGNGIGIAFGMSSNDSAVGASIIHVREGSNSVGRLEFHTNGSDTDSGTVTPRVIINQDGDMIVNQSLEVQENFTVAGTFSPSTVSTNVFTASTNALIGNNDSLDTSPTGTPILQLRRGAGSNNHINFFADSSGCYMISDDVATNQKDLYIAASPTGDDATDKSIIFQTGKTSGDFIERMRIEGHSRIRFTDVDLKFQVGSGNTKGIDFDGDAAIRFDQDNNKLLIERTNGSGVPNQPIITIPTNTSDDLVATVDGHISASRFLGFTPWLLNGGGNWSNAATVWIDLSGGGSESSAGPEIHERRWIAPYDGYIERIVSRVGEDVTAIKFRPYKNTTDNDGDNDSLDQEGQYTAMGSQVSVTTGAGDNQRVVHTFGTSYSFSTGDAIALECQSTGDGPNDLDITMVVMLNITA